MYIYIEICVLYFFLLLYSILSHSILFYSILLYSILLCCTVLYCAVPYCTVLYCAVLYCTVLHCTALHLYICTYIDKYIILQRYTRTCVRVRVHISTCVRAGHIVCHRNSGSLHGCRLRLNAQRGSLELYVAMLQTGTMLGHYGLLRK